MDFKFIPHFEGSVDLQKRRNKKTIGKIGGAPFEHARENRKIIENIGHAYPTTVTM